MCAFEECGRKAVAKSLCLAHWRQQHKGQQLRPIQFRTTGMTIAERLEHFSDRPSDDAYWLWKGTISLSGYGAISGHPTSRYAHRVAYEVYVGPLPAGSVVHHACHVRHCINPRHLQAVTPSENQAEMFERRAYQAEIAALRQHIAACCSCEMAA